MAEQQPSQPRLLAANPSPGQPLPSPTAASTSSIGMASSGTSDAAPKHQIPGHPSFRRQRASRACETCHARKVRCDAASLGVPCTNCVAFSIECKIPMPKRKKTSGKKDADSDQGEMSPEPATDSSTGRTPGTRPDFTSDSIGLSLPDDSGMPETEAPADYIAQQRVNNGTYVQYMKPKFARAPIKEAGRVAYLGESSNLSLLVQERHGTADVVHYPLPENVRGVRARTNELDNVEVDILHQRGAFLLPPRALCDELVEAFFTWIAPVVPVINRSKFMRRYRDSKNPPSLLLLQAILLAGSRVCTNPQLMDANGSTNPAAMTFYKRAKALYDANYEDDRVTIVQALILMGWYWEGPEDVTKNVFYWSRVAVIVAQGSGMHRSVEGSQLSKSDKRLWKRIWWTLFTRDRSVAVALGRPCSINIEDSDLEMISEDDFIDDEPDRPAEYPPDPTHVHFFLNYVKLCEIMGLVLAQQYSVASKLRRPTALDLTHSDMALADWLQHCPPEVMWDSSRHHFWSALLHANYYTTLCLLHRAHMPPAGPNEGRAMNGLPEETAYPSRTIAYQAAVMITSIIEALQAHNQLRFTPAFVLFSALIMHVYQMRSSNQTVVTATQQRLTTCMNALRDVSKVWLVAKMVHTLFESILGNKALEERLQKAAGRRHAKAKGAANGGSHRKTQGPIQAEPEAQKRKYDDIEAGYSNGPPAPQMSYERSRPQSPVGDFVAPPPPQPQQQQQQPQLVPTTSPPRRQRNDAFMGTSRTNTRPSSPFNGYSIPGTPPDFFLHTRNSPKISEDLWQNYQPDQLFPPDTSLFTIQSPTQQMVDPALRGPTPQFTTRTLSQQDLTPSTMHGNPSPQLPQMVPMEHDTQAWSHINTMQPTGPVADDQWSSGSSAAGPIVPTTLNVDEWFKFLGFANGGDMSTLTSPGGGMRMGQSNGGGYG